MIRRVETCWKTLYLELKMWSKLASKNTFFSMSFSEIVTPSQREHYFRRVRDRKKWEKMRFFWYVFVSIECMFWVSFLVTTWWFSTTYGFALVKLMFWKVQAMLSSCVRCLKSGKMRPADSFCSSRARVVYIFEEELNGFLTVNFTWYFVVKICRFRDR